MQGEADVLVLCHNALSSLQGKHTQCNGAALLLILRIDHQLQTEDRGAGLTFLCVYVCRGWGRRRVSHASFYRLGFILFYEKLSGNSCILKAKPVFHHRMESLSSKMLSYKMFSTFAAIQQTFV